MNTRPYISTTDKPTIFLNGKQLAKTLDVSAPTLSEAVKNGYNCGGYPVSEWAEESGNGRIKGYHVPEFLINEENTEEFKKRVNPEPKPTSKPGSSPNEPNKNPNNGSGGIPEDVQSFIDQYTNGQPANVDVQKSWLPPDENYAEPVGMVSLGSVLKKALETNTPESRMLIFASMTTFGGLVGHTVNDNGWGAAAGALSSMGAMYFAYKWLNQAPNNPNLALEEYKRMQVNRNFQKDKSSYIKG